jgi:dsDNA-specific endonuclease/ATPase MutS2
LDRLNPSSPYGQEKVRKLVPYSPKEREQLFLELDNLEKLIRKQKEMQPELNQLRRIFMQMKDVRPALKKAREMCLNDIELFEVKNFLIYSEQARVTQLRIRHETNIEGLDYADTTEALNILDPDMRRIPTFSIYDSYSERLGEIRIRKRALERQMELSKIKEEHDQFQETRRLIVLEEEEEEQKIRELLTQRLQPFLEKMEENAEITGRLDLLLEKMSAALFGKTTKPVITNQELVLENVSNPWVVSVLKEKGLAFTPLSITLSKGAGVITGANMGGKSVALKTITLNVLLALCGFYVYAEKAYIPFFENVLIVSEEMQSVKQGLSSFGAEIVQMQHVAETIDQEFCFVVLDEFSRGTNPHEGEALVRAVTRYLNDKDVIALLVTHYDHVAEYGKVHYQVAGLKDMDMEQVQHEIAVAGQEKGVAVIASHMNYGLYRVDDISDCPRDAFRICRLLGLKDEIMDLITE